VEFVVSTGNLLGPCRYFSSHTVLGDGVASRDSPSTLSDTGRAAGDSIDCHVMSTISTISIISTICIFPLHYAMPTDEQLIRTRISSTIGTTARPHITQPIFPRLITACVARDIHA
jgi:hypothetical protein